MKKLENYCVQEMNTREIKETDGGESAPWHIGWILGRISKYYYRGGTYTWGY